MAAHLELNVDEKSVLPLAKGPRKDIEHSFLPYMEKKKHIGLLHLGSDCSPKEERPSSMVTDTGKLVFLRHHSK